jgi:hypothetical protein
MDWVRLTCRARLTKRLKHCARAPLSRPSVLNGLWIDRASTFEDKNLGFRSRQRVRQGTRQATAPGHPLHRIAPLLALRRGRCAPGQIGAKRAVTTYPYRTGARQAFICGAAGSGPDDPSTHFPYASDCAGACDTDLSPAPAGGLK